MPSLSFFARKSALFTASATGAQALWLAHDGVAGRLSLRTTDASPSHVCVSETWHRLELLFGPLWLSVYIDGRFAGRHGRTGSGAWQLDHDGGTEFTILSADAALPRSSADTLIEPLDMAQLALTAGQGADALAGARACPVSPLQQQLVNRALRQVFEAHKQSAMALAGAGDRAAGLAAISGALALYPPLPARAAPRTQRTLETVCIFADLSLPQCRHYRVEQKVEQLAAAGIRARVVDQADLADTTLADADGCDRAIIYRLPYVPKVQALYARLRAAGVPILYEIDDLLFDETLFPGPPSDYGADLDAAEYHELLILPPLYLAALQAADGAIASTPALADAMQARNSGKPVFLHENGLDRAHRAAMALPRPARRPGRVRLFYGSATRALQSDLDAAANAALAPLMADRADVDLVLAGHADLPACLAPFVDRIIRIAPMDLAAYWQELAKADINLAPLAPGGFNDCKSAIKWLEAAMFGIPSVVSASRTYRELLTDGTDALLCDTWDAWAPALADLVASPAKRAAIGAAANNLALSRFSEQRLAGDIGSILRHLQATHTRVT
ncbi:MAG: glycosyltransferase family 1 protein [Alphaproteobacteria bacterium]|nr:MAG: glycosyltransferase family 1 protein [Alphaproteobacteria bacterium]